MFWRARESSREARPHAPNHQRRFLLAARARSPAARAAARAAPSRTATNRRRASARSAPNSSGRRARWPTRARLPQALPAMSRAAQAPASIPLRRSGIGVIDDATIATPEARDLRHLRLGKLEVEDRKILRQPFATACARNDHDAPLHQEPQAHLRGSFPMRLADARKQFVPAYAAPRHGAIGHGRHAVPAAGRNHLRLVDERMHLDLIADHWLIRKLHGLFDQRDGEVRYADVAGKLRTLDLA